MELLRDGIIAMLAAVGLTAILWGIVGVLFRPRKSDVLPCVTLVMARGDAQALEQTVRAMKGASRHIAIVDCGMSAQARRAAHILTRADDALALWPRGEIEAELAALLSREGYTEESESERWKNEAP